MGNLFRGHEGDSYAASNGLTYVVMARLAVATAERARGPWEKAFARFVATRDQSWHGGGCVGFDLRALPWGTSPWEWDRRKAWVADAVRAAATPEVERVLPWDARLDADTRERQRAELEQLAALFERFDPARAAAPDDWDYGSLRPSDDRCATHGAYLHAAGCLVCRAGG